MTKYNYHTVCRRILGDLVTPVSTYLRLRDKYPQSVLMESSDYHGGENSKSFIGVNPIGRDFDTASLINGFLHSVSISGEGSRHCGLYGYTSFNAVRYFEDI